MQFPHKFEDTMSIQFQITIMWWYELFEDVWYVSKVLKYGDVNYLPEIKSQRLETSAVLICLQFCVHSCGSLWKILHIANVSNDSDFVSMNSRG